MTDTDTIPALISALDDVPDALVGDVLIDLADALEEFPEAAPSEPAPFLLWHTAHSRKLWNRRIAVGLRRIGNRRPQAFCSPSRRFGWQDIGNGSQVTVSDVHWLTGAVFAWLASSSEGLATFPTRSAALLVLAEVLAAE